MGDVAPEPAVSPRVLFVDDDVVTRRAFARALRAQGFIVDLAENGREALALASEYPYALVATDHEMPGITGKELIKRLRDLQPDSKFAVVTGLLDAVEECRDLPEVSAILVKPWRSGELLELVKRAVDEAGRREADRRAARRSKRVAPVSAKSGQHARELTSRRQELARDVLGAVDTERFSLSLQPVCDVADGRVRGHEAFLRFQALDGGELSAHEFLSILDESGEIVRVGRWVIHRACELLARGYPRRGKVSVNVSLRELVAPDFVSMVREALRAHELSGTALELELSESALTKVITDAREKLPALAALGVGIVLDDFGAGRASLSELSELPITKVKLCPRLIQNLSQERARATVGALIAAARCLGWSVVAKSVETREQLEILRSLGCPRAQGLLLGAPRPALM